VVGSDSAPTVSTLKRSLRPQFRGQIQPLEATAQPPDSHTDLRRQHCHGEQSRQACRGTKGYQTAFWHANSCPVVLIVGARQTGKTTLARACRPAWACHDLEKGSDFDFSSRDFEFFFREHPTQVIDDEAQELPRLFKELRGVIDADRGHKNRVILTGSSSPALLAEGADLLAGRLAIVETGTLKMNERQAVPLPSFYRIFESPLGTDAPAGLLVAIDGGLLSNLHQP
jgi:hypothetical protein